MEGRGKDYLIPNEFLRMDSRVVERNNAKNQRLLIATINNVIERHEETGQMKKGNN